MNYECHIYHILLKYIVKTSHITYILMTWLIV